MHFSIERAERVLKTKRILFQSNAINHYENFTMETTSLFAKYYLLQISNNTQEAEVALYSEILLPAIGDVKISQC